MRLRIATQLALWIVAMAVLGYGQSLGDVAKKEKERREKMKAGSRVITNDDTVKYANGPVTTTTPPAPPAGAPAAAKEKAEPAKPAGETPNAGAGAKPKPDEATDFQGRPESFWRQTFTDARQKVKELENKENVLILKIADLQVRANSTGGESVEIAVRAQLQKAFIERDQTSADLAKAKAQLDDLEKEARKSGALPGWIAAKP
ncbi:MAG: hypothetical protein DMG09_12850 [Acidobacteria bacterium]|nr:MAG: hypothetical protein DMG09_12850 [Acidobacteriota bacterium]